MSSPLVTGLTCDFYLKKIMPYKPKGKCHHPGCLVRTYDYYCEDHKKQHQKEYDTYERKYDHKQRYGSRWTKLRNSYIKMNPLCEECLKENHTTPADLVHHIIPIEDGGEIYDIKNLESVCNSCHQKLHSQLKNNKR